jgi:pimeloyl-ACP methyl ester carboxylesterase
MDLPETRYARSGELNIAYQVFGEGPLDVVFVPGIISHLDLQWGIPGAQRFFERLASFSRLILFDKRGTGLSDHVAGPAPLEERMDDLGAVMDAAQSKRAAIIGLSEGGPLAILFSAIYPERVSALALCGTCRNGCWGGDAGVGFRQAHEPVRAQCRGGSHASGYGCLRTLGRQPTDGSRAV